VNAEKLVKENKILKFRIGSFLYGTNTVNSDEDYAGVFMPEENQVFGFETANFIDLSVKDKLESGRNSKEAIDVVFYELRKYAKLSLDNNPNVLETLFVNKENLLFANDFGKELLDNRHLFLHVGLKHRFLGYAFTQKRKMVIRTENFYALKNTYEYLEENFNTVEENKKLLVELPLEKLPFFTVKGDNIQCGDLNFQRHFMVKKVKKMLAERLSKVSNRKDLLLNKGFDTKFGSHLLRLMFEGIELLKTGELIFPLKDRDLILDVKNGKYKMTDVLKMSEELEKEVESLSNTSKLPSKPRYNEVQDLIKKMLKRHFGVK